MERDRAPWVGKQPPLHLPLQLWGLREGPRPGNVGGGGAATAVEKGGRMSATQAENKQTALWGAGWWQKARFPAPAWPSLKQGCCLSKEETEAPRGHALGPERLSPSRPMPIPSAPPGLSFPTQTRRDSKHPAFAFAVPPARCSPCLLSPGSRGQCWSCVARSRTGQWGWSVPGTCGCL